MNKVYKIKLCIVLLADFHCKPVRLFALALCLTLSMHSSHASCSQSLKILVSISPLSVKIQQPTISALLRDRNGFLWIGTQNGLYKFDGIELTKFGSGIPGRNNIASSYIERIVEDSSGRIVIATFGGGVLTRDEKSGEFTRLLAENAEDISYATQLALTRNGRIWIGGKGGLFWYDGQSTSASPNSIVKYNRIEETGEITALMSDASSNVYVAYGLTLYRISDSDNSLEKIIWQREDQNIQDRITALASDQTGTIYIGTDKGNMVSINTSESIDRLPKSIGVGSGKSIISLLFHNNFLWIATSNGLYYTDRSMSSFETLRQNNSALSNNHVTMIYPDNDVIWIGTYQGLNTLSFVPFELFNEQNSGIFDDTLAFEEDSDSNLWIGTFNGLYRYNKQANTHVRFQELNTAEDLVDHRIMTIASKGHELWIGYGKNGAQILDTETFKLSIPPLPNIQQLEVTKILHTNSGETWIATFNRGLYQLKGDSISSYLLKGLPEQAVTIIFETTNGEIFASSEQNIYRYRKSSDSFIPLKLEFGLQSLQPFILSFSQSSEGDIWIGTKDLGLFIWSKENQLLGSMQLENIFDLKGDSPSTIYGIQFDSEGNAWCSTQSGIVKVNSHGEILARFTKYDGLQGSDFNFGSSFKDSLGKIYFGGSSGYNKFIPEVISIARTVPDLLITKISISRGNSLDVFRAVDITNIHLTHKDYFVQFEFSVLDFIDPEKNQYRYMLEGFDREWVENGTRNSATYTSLPPGDYTLRVQGANSAGVWNRDGLSLAVHVSPAPWLTWWAFTLYAFGGIFLVWVFVRARFSYAVERRAKEMALSNLEAEQRADDEMQEQLEIHDDLVKSVYRHSVSTLNLVAELISTRGADAIDESAGEILQAGVNRVDALVLLEECLYYQSELLLADLNKYTNILVSRLLKQSCLAEENIITINEVTAQPFPVEQASLLAVVLFELIENAIQYAFDETAGANYLHIVLQPDKSADSDTMFRLVVQDNGPGIPANIDPLSAQTAGLSTVASMATKLGGNLRFASKSGTVVSIRFPRAGAR